VVCCGSTHVAQVRVANSTLKLLKLQISNTKDRLESVESELKVELGPLRRRIEAASVHRCIAMNTVNVITNNVTGNAPGTHACLFRDSFSE
jgi:hypothetical protein